MILISVKQLVSNCEVKRLENEEEKILKKIEEDVNSNAELVRNAVEGETEALREDQISFYRESLKKETETYLEKELSDLQLYAATKSSKDKMETKKKLLTLRQNLVERLFNDVRTDLKQFSASQDYEDWMRKHLAQIDISESGIFSCKKEDQKLLKKLLVEKGLKNSIETAYLEIGGFLYRDESQMMEYSCSLDEKLKEQEEWFRSHSGFKVAESEDRV